MPFLRLIQTLQKNRGKLLAFEVSGFANEESEVPAAPYHQAVLLPRLKQPMHPKLLQLQRREDPIGQK